MRFVQEWRAYLQDKAQLEPCMKPSAQFTEKLNNNEERVKKCIELAATTKLEFQLLTFLLSGCSLEEIVKQVEAAERHFSVKYKLDRTKLVHKAILKARDQKFADSKSGK